MQNKMIKLFVIVLLAVQAGLLAGIAQAQEAGLEWLAGKWCMNTERRTVEEVWLPDVGGQMMGVSRTIVDGKVVAFEYLRIEAKDGTTQYIAQPGGGAATVFTASLVSANHLVVENPEHDFPQKIAYVREADALTATISGPGDDGQEQAISFDYHACSE